MDFVVGLPTNVTTNSYLFFSLLINRILSYPNGFSKNSAQKKEVIIYFQFDSKFELQE